MIKKLKQFYMDMRISYKLLISYLVVALLILAVVGTTCYKFASALILEKTRLQAQETIYQLSENIEHNVRLINEKLSYLAYNPKVQDILNADISRMDEREQNAVQRDMGRMMVLAYSSASLYDLEIIPQYYEESFYISSSETQMDLGNSEKLKAIAKAGGGKNIIYNDPASNNVQIVKEIKDIVRLSPLGYMHAALRKDLLESMIQEIDFASGAVMTVLDDRNQIVVGEDIFLSGDATRLLVNMAGNFDYTMNGQDYVFLYAKSEYTNWTTVGLIPRAALNKEIFPLQLFIMFFSVTVLVLSILLSRRLSKAIADPIEDVVTAMEDFSSGDLHRRINVERKDEIGKLLDRFNQMSIEISSLIDQIYHNEVLLRESEFKALQAQINPHFLYNTLDTINWMAHKEGMDTISKMVASVSNLMRISISNKKQFVTVEDEIQYVEEYLYIQQIRYKDKLYTSINLDDSIRKQIIPKLILQPIVENAVVHGIENSKKPGKVQLTGVRTGNIIRFTVTDTGIGIPQERLSTLLSLSHAEEGKNDPHSHLGLYTVHRRLIHLYGEEYGLRVHSKEGKGTEVLIEIPYDKSPMQFEQDHRL